MPAPTLGTLLSRWQAAHTRGQSMSPEELCQDCPQLLPEVSRLLDAVRRVEGLMPGSEPESATLPPARPEESATLPPASAAPSPGDSQPTMPPVSSDQPAPPASSGTLSPPDYEISRELGRGGMGVVY